MPQTKVFDKFHFDPVTGIREVFNYIERFKNKIIVLKIEDTLIRKPLFPILIKDIVLLHKAGIKIIIVPGTRDTIDANFEKFGLKKEIHNNIRVTPKEALPIVKLAAMEVIQTYISHLEANGVSALMGNWVKAQSLGVLDGIDFQYTGQIKRIRSELIEQLLEQNFIPVISSMGWNSRGDTYNINSSEVAVRLCEDLDIVKLFFVGLDEGIQLPRENIPDFIDLRENGIIPEMNISEAKKIYSEYKNLLSPKQLNYLSYALKACEFGVNRVHLVSGLTEGSILQEIFSSMGEGTMLYNNKYFTIRQARNADIVFMLNIMKYYVKKKILVHRDSSYIAEHIKDFFVYEIDNEIHGCGSIHCYKDNSAELASIAVDSTYRSTGIGAEIVRFLVEKAKVYDVDKLFLLTTQTSDWFYQFGFVEGVLEDLPKEKRNSYNTDRNSRILVLKL